MIPLVAVFFASGVAGLLYEVVFAKSLALTFGSTADATTTVLTTYMGGLAVGAWLGGRLSSRARNLLRAYAACEIVIGVVCALSPLTLRAIRLLYVALASGADSGARSLLPLRVALGALALIPATVPMGMTLPLLLQRIAPADRSVGPGVAALYTANTLGAAVGALAGGYALLPALGILRTTLLAVAINLTAALAALRLSPRSFSDGVPIAAGSAHPTVGLTVLAVGGALTFSLEVAYNHLLAVAAGNSAYAFALMLFAFLLGLGAGAAGSRRWLRRRSAIAGLVLAELALGVTLLGGVFLWNQIPAWFAAVHLQSFAARELFRFVVCCATLLPPATCVGAIYPLAMSCLGAVRQDHAGRLVGRATALNTLGNVAGALVGGFLLLPRLGSLHTVQLLSAIAFTLAVTAALADSRRRTAAGALLFGTALFALQPTHFDLTQLASGANVYFTADPLAGHVIDHAESLDGGLTTVVASTGRDGQPLWTLRTNGKFQGDTGREVPAQLGFALDSLLHVAARDAALVIGFGTGTTAATLHQAGFARLDIAELSADMLRLADRYFAPVNLGVLHQPNVRAHVTDGRNHLLLTHDQYDLISIEVTSIWFAGAAALYSRDFYRLARAHLRPDGVVQQWIQLHHIYVEDVARILGSLRAEFAHVWLYVGKGQGVLIACDGDCAPRPASVTRLEKDPALTAALTRLGGVDQLLDSRLLDPAGVDQFLASFAQRGVDPASLLSDDDNLQLEYSTPRGNTLTFSMAPAIDAMLPYHPAARFAGTALR